MKLLPAVFCAVTFAFTSSFAQSADQETITNAELLKQMKALEAKVASLEKRLAHYQEGEARTEKPIARSKAEISRNEAPVSSEKPSALSAIETVSSSNEPLFGLGYRSHAILSIGAYGELKFWGNGAPGGWKDGFDAGRIVLLPTFQVTDNIIFNAEIEFEHGIAEDEDDKLTGSVDVEQAYIDFRFNEHFNWRAPGVDVVPFGFINLFHEPTQFYSVQRPELDNGLIPTTWFEGSTSIYGKIVDNLNYQFQINTGLEDIGQNGGVPDGPYDPGISGTEALALARTPIGDFNQTKNASGFALRLSYTPAFVPGLAGSTSVFYTPNVTPRNAHADNGAAYHIDLSGFPSRLTGAPVKQRPHILAAIFSAPGAERLRAWTSWIHLAVGLALPILLLIHIFLGRRTRPAVRPSTRSRSASRTVENRHPESRYCESQHNT